VGPDPEQDGGRRQHPCGCLAERSERAQAQFARAPPEERRERHTQDEEGRERGIPQGEVNGVGVHERVGDRYVAGDAARQVRRQVGHHRTDEERCGAQVPHRAQRQDRRRMREGEGHAVLAPGAAVIAAGAPRAPQRKAT